MRTIAFVLIPVIFFGCTKHETHVNRMFGRTDFFQSNADTKDKVQQYLKTYSEDEIVSGIQSVSYIDSKDKSYAFVFYTSNKGESNLVIRQDYVGEQLVGGSSAKCQGELCNCRVRTLITNDGSVVLDCTCPSCSLVLH